MNNVAQVSELEMALRVIRDECRKHDKCGKKCPLFDRRNERCGFFYRPHAWKLWNDPELDDGTPQLFRGCN